MSYAQNNYSWYPSSKGDVTPAQPGVVTPHLYNTVQQHAQQNLQSQWTGGVHQPPSQPYWQTNQHHQQQQQQQHQPATNIHQQQNHNAVMQNNQWSAPQSSADPWNWGVDDNASSQTTSTATSVNEDAAWDWGVQPSESPASQFAAPSDNNYYVQQQPQPPVSATPQQSPPPPPNNNTVDPADYASTYFYPPQQMQTAQNHTTTNTNILGNYHNAPNENLSQPGSLDYTITNSNNYFVQQPADQLTAPGLVNYHKTEAARHSITPPSNEFHQETHRFDRQEESNYAATGNAYAPSAADKTYAPAATDNSFQTLYHNIADVMGYPQQQQQQRDQQLQAAAPTTDDVQSNNASDNASEASGYATLHDVAGLDYLSATTGNKGLAAQWSTESLHSQGSDDVALPPSRDEQGYHYDGYDKDDEALGGVCDDMGGLHLAATETPPAAENRERETIVRRSASPSAAAPPAKATHSPTLPPPPTTAQVPTPSVQPPPSMQATPITKMTPPPSMQPPPPSVQHPPKIQVPPPGPSKAAAGTPMENPYSGSRIASQGRYRVPNFSSTGEQLGYNPYVQPPVTDFSAAGGSSEDGLSSVGGGGGSVSGEEGVNLETLPDNKERPDAVAVTASDRWPQSAAPVVISTSAAAAERKSVSPMAGGPRTNLPAVGQESIIPPRPRLNESPAPDNQEVAAPGGRCGPDRDQYLETGQLSEDRGWRRMVPGEGPTPPLPPPGLHRMVPGQVTERDGNRVSQFGDDQSQDSNDDVLLQRMVPGQVTPEQPTRGAGGSDIPPPGLRRMVPGESSSPEGQAPQPGSRIVTGDGREEADSSYTAPQAALSPGSAAPGSAPNNAPTQPTAGERSETIGSDSVETYPLPTQPDNTQRDTSSNRRDGSGKQHDRHHRGGDNNETGDESDGRRRAKKDYHGGREREDSPPGGGGGGNGRRYKSDTRKGERDRHGNRHAADDRRPGKEPRGGSEQRRGRQDITDSDNYSSDQYGGGGRYRRDRRDKSSDSRRYDRGGRDERGGGGRQYEGREGYGRDSRNERDTFNKSRRAVEPRGSDSEVNSDYDRRRDYDRKGYSRRRDYDHHGKARYREDYEYRRRYPGTADGGRYREADRSEADRSRFDGSFRDKPERSRPDSRGHQSRLYPADQSAAYFAGPKPQYTAEYYAYYQQLRVTDPVAYAEWYNNVYVRQIYPQSVSYSEDRGSVHSGRSSDNNNAYRERDSRPVTTEPHASSTPQRLTPTFFSTPHVRGVLTNRGQLVKVLPNYPLDGQPATVEIHDVQGLCISNTVKEELLDFPGPLIKGSTHKNSIIAFCQRRITAVECDPSIVDRDSAVLLWQLLILLIKQNGNVVGTDISELLLTTRPTPAASVKRSSVSSRSSQHGSLQGLDEAASSDSSHHASAKFNTAGGKSEEEVTNTFRDYLLYGNVKEALEWAMRNGLWGHALFLASKTDPRQHANVMMRFANGLPFNDPLQTLYQIKSGRQPAAVTGCSDEKWGSWKPHLAMILANPSSPEVGHKAILTLGDTLAARGCLYAAHFTYLMAQTEFSTWSQRSTARLVLIGSSHHHKNFRQFATSEAIQMTEVYEYASRLADPDNAIPSFQWFKYVYALRLMEQNLTTEALQYAEEVSKVILSHPDLYEPSLFKQVYELGDQLKYRDPLYTNSGGLDDDSVELPWLVGLRQTLHNFNMGIHPSKSYPSHESLLNQSYSEADHLSQPPAPYPPHHHDTEPLTQAAGGGYDPMVASDGYETALSDEGARYTQYAAEQQQQQQLQQQQHQQQQQQQQQWQQQQQQQWQQHSEHENTQVYESSQIATDSASHAHLQNSYQNQWEDSAMQAEEPVPQITLPNAERKERPAEANASATQPPAAKGKPPQSPQARGKPPAGNGWFGGIWNKLSLKPKNQMILPEDKNPTIVWDQDRKRWVNMDADGEEVSTELAPPPKASDMPGAFSAPTYAPSTATAAPRAKENGDPAMHPPAPVMANGSAVNKYKLNNKGKSFRSNYVDVFGSSKMAPQSAPPPGLFPLMAGGTQSIFTPGPQVETNETESSTAANDGMFEAPHRQPSDQQAPHEVYAPNVSDARSAYTGPMMYDPRAYAQANANQHAH